MLVFLAGSCKSSVCSFFHFRTLISFFQSYFLNPKISKIGAISFPDAKENQWRQISNIFSANFSSLLGAIFSSFLILTITFVCFFMVFCNVTLSHRTVTTSSHGKEPLFFFLWIGMAKILSHSVSLGYWW